MSEHLPGWQRLALAWLPQTLRGRLLVLGSLSLILAASLVLVLMSLQQQRLLRSEWAASLSAQAELIATNTVAAVSFGDAVEAERLLSALANSRFVFEARVVLADGRNFARYADDTHEYPADDFVPALRPTPAGHVFHDRVIAAWAPILEGQRVVARVELLGSLKQIEALSARALRDSLAVLLLVLAVSVTLTWRVLHRLLVPVAELGALMRRLAADTRLSERVRPDGGTEIADLGRGFNTLIDTIQARDAELEQYRGNLERLVDARTRALERAIADAREANRSKSAFLARMSHEIRTPMNAIVGLGRLLQRSPLSRPQRDQIDKLLASSQSLLGVIDDVLDYSRIEAGKLTLERIPFDLGEVCQRALGVVALRAEEKGVELIHRVGADVPRRVIGDPLRLGQVLINLLGNAIKFTAEGEVVLEVGLVAQEGGPPLIRFVVRDTGIGIDPEQRERLFDPFSQVDDSMTRRFGGTGLGLSICVQLVRMMEGTIALDSEPGQGAAFSVELPLAAVAGASGHGRANQPFGRALVIDDNATAAAVLVELLQRNGIEAEACVEGEAGLALLQSAATGPRAFDLIVADWQMPGMDGLQLAERMQALALPGARPAFVLAITLGTYEAVAPRLIKCGVDAVLVKPATAEGLLDALAEAAQPRAVGSARREAGVLHEVAALEAVRGARILVVDDLPLNREVAREFLSIAGLEVEEAANGREALDRLAREGIDLVLMDIQMPVLDGLETTRLIRSDARLRALPVIAMTAHAMSGSREQSLGAGMNDHLTKPIDPDALYAVLLKWVTPRSPAPGLVPALQRPTSETPLPALDGVDTVRGLANHMGRMGLYRRILEGFRLQFGDAASSLADAVERQDLEQARRFAHSLKSAAATIGASQVSMHARELEQQLQRGQWPGEAARAALQAALDTVLRGLARLRADAGAHVQPPAARPTLQHLLATAARLDERLARHDAAAETLVGELADALRGSAYEARLADLRELVEDVEYERARALLDALRPEFERIPS